MQIGDIDNWGVCGTMVLLHILIYVFNMCEYTVLQIIAGLIVCGIVGPGRFSGRRRRWQGCVALERGTSIET